MPVCLPVCLPVVLPFPPCVALCLPGLPTGRHQLPLVRTSHSHSSTAARTREAQNLWTPQAVLLRVAKSAALFLVTAFLFGMLAGVLPGPAQQPQQQQALNALG